MTKTMSNQAKKRLSEVAEYEGAYKPIKIIQIGGCGYHIYNSFDEMTLHYGVLMNELIPIAVTRYDTCFNERIVIIEL